MTNGSPKYLILAQVLRPHGVRGELRTRILTDFPERIGQLKTVYLGRGIQDPDVQAYSMIRMRMHKAFGLITLKEITDRDQADRLREKFIMVTIDQAVPLEDDEFYLFQLYGLTVRTEDGLVLGTITNILETGANDVYIIRSETYGEVLFPATHETIIDHDIANGEVIVTIPDGLLPDPK